MAAHGSWVDAHGDINMALGAAMRVGTSTLSRDRRLRPPFVVSLSNHRFERRPFDKLRANGKLPLAAEPS